MKNIFLLLVILIATILFVGCNNAGKNENSSEKNGKIVIWQTETDPQAIDTLKAIIGRFEKIYSINVELESVPWNSLANKLAIAINTNNVPDISHLEPFMTWSIASKDLLLPIDDVISQIEKENNDSILRSVKDLQLYGEHRYGIAYAVGVTGYAYRKDIVDKLGLQIPQNWDELIIFLEKVHKYSGGKLKVLLPGGDPFFIDQLYAELLANNGGKLFDPNTLNPLLDAKESIEVLKFFKEISPYVDESWQNTKYLDQFNRLGRGDAILVPVTYVRAAKSIERTISELGKEYSLQATPEYFGLMRQPVGWSYHGESISTIDCEPFVIFKESDMRNIGNKKASYYAKEFLKYFYLQKNYIQFVKTVPIHLTPIFKNMASGDSTYLNAKLIKTWQPWQQFCQDHLNDPNSVRPILMPDGDPKSKEIPFLLDFQAKNILTEAVNDVIYNHLTPEKAASIAQTKALSLLQNLGYETTRYK